MTNKDLTKQVAELKKELDNAQRKQCESEQRLIGFAGVADGWLFETDTDNRFVWMSDNVEEINGTTEKPVRNWATAGPGKRNGRTTWNYFAAVCPFATSCFPARARSGSNG